MIISPSSARAWGECGLSWWLSRHAVPSNPEPDHMRRGSIAHEALAAAYRAARDRLPEPGVRSMLAFREPAEDVLDDAEEQWSAAEVSEIRTRVLATLRELPIPRPRDVLAVEKPYRFTSAEGNEVSIVLDLALRLDPVTVLIRDWKWTNAPAPETLQGGVYTAAGRRLWPWAETVKVSFYSLKDRGETPLELVNDIVKLRMDELDYVAAEQADALAELERGGGRTGLELFPPTTGAQCTSCRYRTYCPAYKAPARLAPGMTAQDAEATRDDLMRRLGA